jgi:hypothetical protein
MTRSIMLPEGLKRIPGLYRRWELPDVLEAHRSYHIEQAGCDSDGTPLLAVYGDFTSESDPDHPAFQDAISLTEIQLADRWHLSPRSLQRWRHQKTGPAYFRVGSRRVLYNLVEVESYERRRHSERRSLVLGSGGGRHG